MLRDLVNLKYLLPVDEEISIYIAYITVINLDKPLDFDSHTSELNLLQSVLGKLIVKKNIRNQ